MAQGVIGASSGPSCFRRWGSGSVEPAMTRRRYAIRTYGCQMNIHDSEKLANLLQHAGLESAAGEDEADLLVINTCSIRDKAEQKMHSALGRFRRLKRRGQEVTIGIVGCVAQQEGQTLAVASVVWFGVDE